MYKCISRLFLPCTLCFSLLSGGICLTLLVQNAQAAQATALSGKLYAAGIDDYSRTHNRGYNTNKRYKKNDPSRLHDNRYHEKNSQYNQGRGRGSKRNSTYDRNHSYDGTRDNRYDRGDHDRRYDDRNDDTYIRDRVHDGIRDGMREILRNGSQR